MVRKYVWLLHPWTDADGNSRPGQLAVLTGNHCSMLLVEQVPHGFKLTDADGSAETLPFLPGSLDDDPFDPAA